MAIPATPTNLTEFSSRLTCADVNGTQIQVDRATTGVVTLRVIKPAKGTSPEVKIGVNLSNKDLELLAAVVQGVRDS